MSDNIGDDDLDDIIIPDVPVTALAYRTWRTSEEGNLLSINAPSLTGKAGGSTMQGQQGFRRVTWIHRHLADPEGQNGWPIGVPLVAHCGQCGKLPGAPVFPPGLILGPGAPSSPGAGPGLPGVTPSPVHDRIPDLKCSCGIYATTSIKVINQYLGNETVNGLALRGPVLGIVELGGKVIPATQGYRAAYARVAAIMLIDPVFSLPHAQLRQIAEHYRVPALRDDPDKASLNPEFYRDQLTLGTPSADEVEEWLKGIDPDGGE